MQLLSIASLSLFLLLLQLFDKLASLVLLFLLLPSLVFPLRSLLLNGHDLVVVDLFESYLAPFFLTPVILQKFVEALVLILVETVFDAVSVNEFTINFLIPRHRILLKVVFIGWQYLVAAAVSSWWSMLVRATVLILIVVLLFLGQRPHVDVVRHVQSIWTVVPAYLWLLLRRYMIDRSLCLISALPTLIFVVLRWLFDFELEIGGQICFHEVICLIWVNVVNWQVFRWVDTSKYCASILVFIDVGEHSCMHGCILTLICLLG